MARARATSNTEAVTDTQALAEAIAPKVANTAVNAVKYELNKNKI